VTTALVAGAAAATELPDLNVFAVTVAEHQDGSGWHLSFQVALTVTPQDVAAGLDSYVITSSDGVTFYGGIQRWASADGTLTFELDEAAADTLGLDPTVTIALPADASV
jgi:hypothetical protein